MQASLSIKGGGTAVNVRCRGSPAHTNVMRIMGRSRQQAKHGQGYLCRSATEPPALPDNDNNDNKNYHKNMLVCCQCLPVMTQTRTVHRFRSHGGKKRLCVLPACWKQQLAAKGKKASFKNNNKIYKCVRSECAIKLAAEAETKAPC